MISPRIRRLVQDYELLQRILKDWPLIQITGTAGLPPELYRFTYRIRGLYVSGSGDILEREAHVLEVNLSLGYPRRAPQCRMLTPVFHPNFDDATVCIGDFWAASEGLDDLIIRIGRMIAYQEYNTKSPLNGLAAKWAAQNTNLLPVDPRSVAPPVRTGEDAMAAVAGTQSPAPSSSQPQPQPLPQSQPASAENVQPVPDDPWAQKIVIT
ncbi:MAG TPA: ubiquitin-conjugating enzyme E2 [Candidatus Dormibacteraeota bacterium]|jgi:ubiquitin-protein ligase|nr:ubiquitin-conjugating enzyme E2 [Candidatus Dormibacteraeota bacterium]